MPESTETRPMDRLDLELYADRLARHASRIADEIAACRLRMQWRLIETDARYALPPEQMDALEALGVIAPAYEASGRPADNDDALYARRIEQLKALAALQVFVEGRIAAL